MADDDGAGSEQRETLASLAATAPATAAHARLDRVRRQRVLRRIAAGADHGYRSMQRREEAAMAFGEVLEAAHHLGLVFVGVSEYRVLPYRWRQRENFVSKDGVVRVSARRSRARGAEAGFAPYFLSTTFDDGSVVLTWGKDHPPLTDTADVDSTGGIGDLLIDHDDHRQRVQAHLARRPGIAPIVVRDIEDCVALNDYFERVLLPEEQARALAVIWPSVLLGGAGALALAVTLLAVLL